MTADEPTAIRHPKRGKAHREQTTAEAVAMGALPGAVTGCSRWALSMTECVPLSQIPTTDRCRTCWPTTKEAR